MKRQRRSILFLSWKDITNPASGGAEVLTDALAAHMAKTHDVTLFTSSYPGCREEERYNGYKIIRKGNLYSTILYAFLFWHRTRDSANTYDHIIDQVHGIPFFSVLYARRPKILLLVMEVAGNLWGNALPPALRIGGKFAEKLWLTLYRSSTIITISESTKRELTASGIPKRNIRIIPMFADEPPPNDTPRKDNTTYNLLVLGRIAPVKQIQDAIAAYAIAKKNIPTLRLAIVGKSEAKYRAYKEEIRKLIANDPDISLHEHCTEEEKQIYISNAHLLLMTSQKEGYGLVILEAASHGVPTIGYRVPGIQDAITHNVNGILVPHRDTAALAQAISDTLNHPQRYNELQQGSLAYARRHDRVKTGETFHSYVTSAA